jgi:acetyl esterase/lipase
LRLENNTLINLLTGEIAPADITENKDVPSLQVVLPSGELNRNVSIIVIPGGGYTFLPPHEMQPVADWLSKAGYTCFILRYRLAPAYVYPVPFQDVQRAIRQVRSLIQDNSFNSAKLGVIGFSAGGHLVSTVSTHFSPQETGTGPGEPVNLRPDFQILVYPLISLFNRPPERLVNILGANPSADDIELLSNDKHVTSQTPPAFVFHSIGDQMVGVLHSDLYTASLKEAGVPYEYVRGDYGGHGIAVHPYWTDACLEWLETVSATPASEVVYKK